MTYNVRNIAIAIVMAIAAAAVVLVYTTSYRQSVTRGQKRVDVMVASRDIVAGTPAVEAAGAMTLTSVLADDKAPGALSTTAGLEGKVTGQAIFAGQQVVAAAFGTSTTQAAQLQITKTERAIRVSVDRASGVIGQIHAGDFIDVFATIKVAGGDAAFKSSDQATSSGGGATGATNPNSPLATGSNRVFTRRLLTKVRVLEVPEETSAKGGLAKNAKDDSLQVMLAVSQADAGKLAFSQSQAENVSLWFVVRPPEAVAQDMPLTIESLESMLADGVTPAELKKKYAEAGRLLETGGH